MHAILASEGFGAIQEGKRFFITKNGERVHSRLIEERIEQILLDRGMTPSFQDLRRERERFQVAEQRLTELSSSGAD